MFTALNSVVAALALAAPGEPAEVSPRADVSIAQTDAEESVAAETVWGAVARPLQLGWRIEPKQEFYKPGEVIEVTLSVRNAGSESISVASPRTQILQKHGVKLELRGQHGANRPWSWGPALERGDHLEVSGATTGVIPAGGLLTLPKFRVMIGGDKAKLDKTIGAYLDARPGEESAVYFSIDSIGIARSDEALLSTGAFEFRLAE